MVSNVGIDVTSAVPSHEELALAHLARAIPSGHTAVITEIVESDEDAVEAARSEVRRVLTDSGRTHR
ncbi:hypothetical protein [Pseudonocardia asaccharolytica]|uniref:Uncharacterized protein n=1 Tax=Pseudonocardia asaccharolytica DSM 44247 = NBRC 16224 TaxID=1123024 RepID=A0A511CWV5_9PSEU|nr:hypothetical protein [Pseudonocardia asaccharolytica]GEL17041.1 hypothetical protein PA7_08780 [Pseudonocardia asaccharolytica DSM 44247 = NBRC 16224]